MILLHFFILTNQNNMTTKLKYPKTVYISIALHSAVELDNNNIIDTFTVPKNMTITKISSAIPGLTYIAPDNLNNIIGDIHNYIITVPNMDINRIKNHLICNDLHQNKLRQQQQNLIKKKRKFEEIDDEIIDYNNLFDSCYQINTYNSADCIINKSYQQKPTELNPCKIFDCHMVMLNSHVPLNLLNEIPYCPLYGKFLKKEYTNISLKNIIKFLEHKKVKHIILMDFSCSSFYEKEKHTYITDKRLIRSLRRDTRKRKLFD